MTRTNFIAPALAAILTLVASRPAAAQYEQVEQPADKGATAIQNAFALQGPISHGDLLDLGEDDHLQYALLAGRAGGQILSGGTNSGDALSLQGSTANDGNIVLNALGGNVGIGTGTPAALLDVNGNANVAGNLSVAGTLSVPGSFDFTGDLTVDGTVFTHFVTANSPLQLQTDGVTRVYIDDNLNNGRVGIGNPPPVPPQFPLDVNGAIHSNDDIFVDGSLSLGNANPFWAIEVVRSQAVARLVTTVAANGSVVELRTFNAGGTLLGAINFNDAGNTTPGQLAYRLDNSMTFRTGGVENMRLDGMGNLGIGTTTPTSKLHVVGDTHTTGNATFDGAVLTHFVNGNSPLELQTDGVTRIYIDDNGNNGHVGVGNAPPVPPAFPLDVNGDIHTNAQLRSSVPDGTAPLVVASMTLVTNLNAEKLGGFNETDFALLGGRAGGQQLNGGTNAGDPLTLNGSATNDGPVIINPTGGNVGIMTTTPGEKLDVVGGNVRTDGQFISTIPDGTAPMVVTSMTLVTNFNADKVDGRHEDEFALLAGRAGGQVLNGGTNNNDPLTLNGSTTNDGNVLINPNGGNVGIMTTTPGEKLDVVGGNIRTNQQLISTIPDGTAPLVVDSMTIVTNLNSDKLDGRHENEFALLAGRPGGQVLHGGDGAGDDLVLDSTADPMKGFVILNPTPVGPGTGSVGIGTMNPTEALEVIGCIKADCLKITAPNFVGVSPLGMVRAGTSIDVLAQVDGTAKVRATVVGTHSTMIPVNLHTSLFGTQQKLANVQVFYKVTSPNSFIAVTRARIMGPNGTFTNLAVNATQQKSTVWASYLVTPAAPVDITGPLYLNFELNYTGTNTAHDIQIGQIILTTVE